MSLVLSGDSGVSFNDGSQQGAAASPYGLKNRIINGDMRIAQRSTGSVTASTTSAITYGSCDRWAYLVSQGSKFTYQQSSTAPTGFTNSLLVTSSSAYTVGASDTFNIVQPIEGFNCADLGFGAAGASTVTISFWVRSSLTGTFGGVLCNYNIVRTYPFTYTISAANTWEKKTITITGDTTGTWYTDNSAGLQLMFSLGTGSSLSGTAGAWSGSGSYGATGATSVVGTNGATWYITGVQLEVGSTATPFERRMYGTELQLCQRYCLKLGNDGVTYYTPYGFVTNTSSTGGLMVVQFPTTMRATPTLVSTTPNRIISGSVNNSVSSITLGDGSGSAAYCDYVSTGLTIGQSGFIGANGSLTARLLFSAEL